jgi:hypothetical protein
MEERLSDESNVINGGRGHVEEDTAEEDIAW